MSTSTPSTPFSGSYSDQPLHIRLGLLARSHSHHARSATDMQIKSFYEGAAHAYLVAAQKIRDEAAANHPAGQ